MNKAKVSLPYTNQPLCSYVKLPKYKHVNNAPYMLWVSEKEQIHLYEIDKAKHHSLRKEDNEITINQSNTWRYITTIKIKSGIDHVLYSKFEKLLWFIYKSGINIILNVQNFDYVAENTQLVPMCEC